MSTIELTVDGMTCDGCERSVANAVGRLEGVTGVTADHSSGAVIVTAAGSVAAEDVKAAIEDAGYAVRS